MTHRKNPGICEGETHPQFDWAIEHTRLADSRRIPTRPKGCALHVVTVIGLRAKLDI
jgi:hypothetical protein